MKRSATCKLFAGILIISILASSASGLAAVAAAEENAAPSDWARVEIEWARQLNLVPDSVQSAYRKNITRLELAALTARLIEAKSGMNVRDFADSRQSSVSGARFRDTEDVNITSLAALGVINGVGGGGFNPSGEVTREQAAKILATTAKLLGMAEKTSTVEYYKDSEKISAWAVGDVGFALAYSIMKGTDVNYFMPQGSITREQAIVTMLRLYNRIKASEGSPADRFWATRSDEELTMLTKIGSACLLRDDGTWAQSFAKPEDISSNGLYNFYLVYGVDTNKWFNETDRLYHIPLAEVKATLDKYFASYTLDPLKVTSAEYSSGEQAFVTGATAGMDLPKFMEVTAKDATTGSILRLTAADYNRTEDPNSAEIMNITALTLSVTDDGYKLVSYANLYDYEKLYDNKGKDTRDSDRMTKIYRELSFIKHYPNYVIVVPASAVNEVRLTVELELKPGEVFAVNHTLIMRDAVILFALIEGLDSVKYDFTQGEYSYSGSISRAEADKVFGGSIKSYGQSKEMFTKVLPRKINELIYNPDVKSTISCDRDVM